jgi:2,3-bisphosphoglycerate-independent phosphoglycerate mutase
VLFGGHGLGGFPHGDRDTELEVARTPNLDRLADEGSVGLTLPAGPGITVGSGPGHLALFGYDPLEHDLGRGVLSAVGLGFDLQPGDIAARGNLASLDADGNVTDRRAGRIPDAEAREVVDHLRATVQVDGVQVFFEHESEHRVLLVIRGEWLDHHLADMDPQHTGVPPLEPRATEPEAEQTVPFVRQVDQAIRDALAETDSKADVLLLRGFDTLQELPSMQDRFGVDPAVLATYPMYRGVARLVGMRAVEPVAGSLAEQVQQAADHWDDHDYLFLHAKEADRAGHDGERDAKITALEAVDAVIDDLAALEPDVLVVTGDHSAPPQLHAHSWHPVPTLMWGPWVGRDAVTSFGERACAGGLLGHMRTQDLMPLMLASGGRLEKYGA